MKKLIFTLIILFIWVVPAHAAEYTAPPVPESYAIYMPSQTQSFGEGIWSVIKFAISRIRPDIADAASICLSVIAVILLTSLFSTIPGSSRSVSNLVGAIGVGILILKPTHSLIGLGAETIEELSAYGKLLLPVMTSALAAQGGFTSSAALYTGTALFCSVLTHVISRLLVPLIYIYLCLSIGCTAIGDEMLKRLRDFVKWFMSWGLKTLLYIFTGYLTITGVVSGTADASAIKAAKLTISGAVPVVGGILSDASETILVSAGIMKSSAGIYGLLAMAAICISPFLKISLQYIFTKITAAICGVIGSKESASFVNDFAAAMGIVLAMTGAVCLFLLISTVCFMKGVS